MSLKTQPYKGARDFYPEDMRIRNYIFSTWRKVCQSYGYEEYDAPILEPVELFTAKSGDELVNEQSYNFVDRGGREVMLRPEMTPSVSRLVAGKRQELPLPIRWFSIPSCWRYERPQKGRGREFYQLNIDLFGVDNVLAEVEMLQMISSLLKSFNAKPSMYEIRVNSRGLMSYILGDWLGLNEVEQKTISRLIDRMHKINGPEFAGLIEASIPPSLRDQGAAEKLLNILKATKLSDLPKEIIDSEAAKKFIDTIAVAEKAGILNLKFDITLIRGLDYYTDFVFEVFDTDPDNNRALFGGGRYDGLVGLFGVEPLPTIGFAMSDVMLLEFLKGHDLLPNLGSETEVAIVTVGDTAEKAQKLAEELREMEVNTSIDITGRKLDKQLKSVAKTNINYVLFVGEEELANEQYKLKDLNTGIEQVHSIHRIVSIIKDHRNAKI